MSAREERLDAVRLARDGDIDAFETLVRANAPAAYRLALAISGQDLAADVVQDAFLQAWRGLARLRDPDRFVPWLHRIVANRARSTRRAERRVTVVELGSTPDRPMTSSEDGFAAAEARALVDPAFRRLSVAHRTVIGLHYGAGLSLREVADALGVPIGTAKSRLAAALEALRADVARGKS